MCAISSWADQPHSFKVKKPKKAVKGELRSDIQAKEMRIRASVEEDGGSKLINKRAGATCVDHMSLSQPDQPVSTQIYPFQLSAQEI